MRGSITNGTRGDDGDVHGSDDAANDGDGGGAGGNAAAPNIDKDDKPADLERTGPSD